MAKENGIITLRNGKAECRIALFGGNLLSYRPISEEQDIFWLGDLNKFDNIQAIRGGIPVCWPRFAEEKLNERLPRHGFARLSMWELKKAEVNDSHIEAELTLTAEAKYCLNAEAKVCIKISDKLEYSLETTNLSNEEFIFSEALHAYFNVSAVDKVKIHGLDKHQYHNSLDGKIYTQAGDLQITDVFDSIFLQQTQPIEIIDLGFKRVILLEKQGSNTTVVWNPNKDLAEMSPNQYKNFVCVEPSNVGEYCVKLAPQEKHKISVVIKTQKLG